MDHLGTRITAERKDARHADPAGWLSDEVAIDFPSVDAVVERMTEAFWGAADAVRPTIAEVRLSARQAFDGASVPLDVLLRATCTGCGGRGETWTESCRVCDGSGESLVAHQVMVLVPARVADGASFRFSISAPHALPSRIELRVAIR